MSEPIPDAASRTSGDSDEKAAGRTSRTSENKAAARLAFVPMSRLAFFAAVVLMGTIVVASNLLVQIPLNDWLTWGGLSYPVAFLVTDLLNRRFGPHAARRVAWTGFAAAVIVSLWAASPRIAAASGVAFIASQLLDIQVFHRLRDRSWWMAPALSGLLAAILDTALFFSIAFAGTPTPWVTWGLGDLGVKLALNLCMLAPFRALMWNIARPARFD